MRDRRRHHPLSSAARAPPVSQSASRTSQRSGKKRRSTVERRYSTPGEPPVPCRVPISRAAISAWWWRQRRDPLVVVDEQLRDVVPGRAQRIGRVVAVERRERLQARVAVLRQPETGRERLVQRRAGRRLSPARPGPALARQPLDLAELARLEARGGRERVAELEEALRAHRLEHLELVEQQPLHGDHAAQARCGDVRAPVRRARRAPSTSSCRISLNHSSYAWWTTMNSSSSCAPGVIGRCSSSRSSISR